MPNETKWTPGPWRPEPYYDNWDIMAGDLTLMTSEFESDDFISPDEEEANIKLAAAAPDLYAALEAASCDDCGNTIGEPRPWPQDECPTCKPARAALAKARGDQIPDAR